LASGFSSSSWHSPLGPGRRVHRPSLPTLSSNRHFSSKSVLVTCHAANIHAYIDILPARASWSPVHVCIYIYRHTSSKSVLVTCLAAKIYASTKPTSIPLRSDGAFDAIKLKLSEVEDAWEEVTGQLLPSRVSRQVVSRIHFP